MSEGSKQIMQAPSQPLTLTPDEERVVRALLSALRRIQHGSVQLVVQDSRVVQIDTVEKMRFTHEAPRTKRM
jgi:hypothetical protein